MRERNKSDAKAERQTNKMSSEVEIGQRYRQVSLPQEVWEVVLILSNAGVIPHARLVRVGSSKDVKTISFPALQDKKLYQIVA